MAKDDYFVLSYQLLKYLYECLKRGKRPGLASLNADFFGIAESYWEYILRNLQKEKCITGILVGDSVGRIGPEVVITDGLEITPFGIQYLSDNSTFNKIKGTIKELLDIIP